MTDLFITENNNTIELYNGDCLEIMPTLKGKKIDLILTDVPFGITQCKWDIPLPMEQMWDCINNIIHDNTAIALFGSEPFASKLRLSNLKKYRYDIIWSKNQGSDFLNAKHRPMKSHESISLFFNKKPTYNPQWFYKKPYKAKSGGYNNTTVYRKVEKMGGQSVDGRRYPLSVIEFSKAGLRSKKKSHPTEKPVPLLEWFIKTYTNENDTVLDFTMGSGSTGEACKNLNRNFIGIELNNEYYEIARDRLRV